MGYLQQLRTFFCTQSALGAGVALASLLSLSGTALAENSAAYKELPRFHQVNEHLFRGGQPKPGGFVRLAELGIRTVVNLRDESAGTKRDEAPAERAGLQGFRIVRQRRRQGPFSYDSQTIDRNAADLIVAVDGKKVLTAEDFLSAVEEKNPGQDVVITVVRGGQEVNVPVRLSAVES